MRSGSSLDWHGTAERRNTATGRKGRTATGAKSYTIALAALLLAGCGGASVPAAAPVATDAVAHQASTPTPQATQLPAPVVTPTPQSSAISGIAHIKDSDGYTFDVPYVITPLTVEKQVASEKPGFNSLVIKLHAELSVVNTTQGRDLTFKGLSGTTRPFGDPKIGLVGLWPSDSPVCTYANGAAAASGGKPCGVILADMHLPDGLGAGQTASGTVYAGWENMAPGLAHVPDNAVAGLDKLLLEPQTIVVIYLGNDAVRFRGTCPNPDLLKLLGGSWNYTDLVLYTSGLLPIFSTAGSCAVNDFVTQPPPE